MSHSVSRAKPWMDEPSKVTPRTKGFLELLHGDGDALDVAKDVGKPEANELDVLLHRSVEDVVNGLAFAPQDS